LVQQLVGEEGSHCGRLLRIVDPSGTWMQGWRDKFQALGITHLRSHIAAHPSPRSTRELQVWDDDHDTAPHPASKADTPASSSLPFDHVGRDGAFLGPFLAPSTPTFHAFCDHLVHRARLTTAVEADAVTALHPEAGSDGEPRVRVLTASGRVIIAGAVVVATGPGTPRMPDWAVDARMRFPEAPAHTLSHVWHILPWIAPGSCRLTGARVIVVGGGLTAAQLARAAIREGASHVTLLSRAPVVVKQFDIDPEWVSWRTRAGKLNSLWSHASAEARAALVAEARGGGSMPREAVDELLHLVAERRADWHQGVQAVSACWWADRRTWSVRVSASGHKGTGTPGPLEAHMVWLATGAEATVSTHPLLGDLHARHPIAITATGLPKLLPSLRWSAAVPVYVTGAMASLQVGPDAANLVGAQTAACRIAACLRRSLWNAAAAMARDRTGHEPTAVAACGDGYGDNEPPCSACHGAGTDAALRDARVRTAGEEWTDTLRWMADNNATALAAAAGVHGYAAVAKGARPRKLRDSDRTRLAVRHLDAEQQLAELLHRADEAQAAAEGNDVMVPCFRLREGALFIAGCRWGSV
jgi:hypothetical protein